MIRKGDVRWWILEARNHPESAPIAIQALADRLVELDAENERLRDELLRQRQRTPAESSSEVKSLRLKIERLEALLKSQAAIEPMAVLLSEQLCSARIPLSEVRALTRTGSAPLSSRALLSLRCMLVARPHGELLLITSQGRGLILLALDTAPWVEGGDWPNEPSPTLASDEHLAVATAVETPPRFWTIATRRGYVQRFVRAAFEREMTKGDPLLRSLLDRDEATAIIHGDRGDVLLVTRWGQATRFSHRVIDVQGSIALDLEHGDQVVSALSLPDDGEILVVTASGRAIRRHTRHLPARSKPGDTRGKRLIQAQDALAVFPYVPGDALLFATFSGRMVMVGTDDVPLVDRLGKGTQVCDLDQDTALAVAVVPRDML